MEQAASEEEQNPQNLNPSPQQQLPEAPEQNATLGQDIALGSLLLQETMRQIQQAGEDQEQQQEMINCFALVQALVEQAQREQQQEVFDPFALMRTFIEEAQREQHQNNHRERMREVLDIVKIPPSPHRKLFENLSFVEERRRGEVGVVTVGGMNGQRRGRWGEGVVDEEEEDDGDDDSDFERDHVVEMEEVEEEEEEDEEEMEERNVEIGYSDSDMTERVDDDDEVEEKAEEENGQEEEVDNEEREENQHQQECDQKHKVEDEKEEEKELQHQNQRQKLEKKEGEDKEGKKGEEDERIDDDQKEAAKNDKSGKMKTEGSLPQQPQQEVLCKHCREPTSSSSQWVLGCDKCRVRSEMYCSKKCRTKGRIIHAHDDRNFHLSDRVIRKMHEPSENQHHRHFETLKDVPGIEHEFLGGTKISVVLKLGPAVPDLDHTFVCQDIEGEETLVVFQDPRPEDIVTRLDQMFSHLYFPILGASFINVNDIARSSTTTTTTTGDLGFKPCRRAIAVNFQSIPNFYRVFMFGDDTCFGRSVLEKK